MHRILKVIILLLILVGLPLGTWLLMNEGISFRREVFKTMQNHGAFPLDSTTYRLIDTSLSKNNITLIYYRPRVPSVMADSVRITLSRIVHQFSLKNSKEQPIVVYEWMFPPVSDSLAKEKPNLSQWNQVIIDSIQDERIHSIMKQAQLSSRAEGNHVIYLDQQLAIRNNYDLTKGEDIDLLIKHIALNLIDKKERK